MDSTTSTFAEGQAVGLVRFAPTPEQQEALRLFATGNSLVIEAGAGTGKTSTLKLLAESAPNRRGQYLAFNRAIVEESKQKFPTSVRCNTAHSAAFRVMVQKPAVNMDRLRSPRMKSWDIAARLGITQGIRLETQDGERKNLSATYLAGLTMKAVTAFCQSADPEPTAFHVPYIKGIDVPPGAYANNREVARTLVPYMRRAWADLMTRNGSLPFQHDHYLKAWQLDDPRIAVDFILFDEAQDANPVLVDIVKRQEGHAQLVWVGDSQQQIYTFTGAVNAMQTVGAEQTTYLTQSFRFGPAIAETANRILGQIEGAQLRLTGLPTIESTVGPIEDPDAILTRTNAEAVRNVLQAIKAGKRPHLVGGATEIVSFAKAAQALMDGAATEHPDLACFDSWNEVVEYVEQDEQGGDLQQLVKLIDEFTVAVILDALDNMAHEGSADVIVSTAHKSKGREWNTVQLGGDFPDQPEAEELRLLYVSITRAKMRLDHDAVPFLSKTLFAASTQQAAASADAACTCGVAEFGLAYHTQTCPAYLAGHRTPVEGGPMPEVDHDAPEHDFASCPRCIRRAREAAHQAEGGGTASSSALGSTPTAEGHAVPSAPSAPSTGAQTRESARPVTDEGDGYGKPENAPAPTIAPGDLIFRLYAWREITTINTSDGQVTLHYVDDSSAAQWVKVPAAKSVRIRRKAVT